MGINGLLPMMKPFTKKIHINDLRGKRVAIDGYSWLHKGAYTCSTELCLNIPTEKFVHYFLQRLQTLINCGLVPTVVFDGGQLPMKKEELNSRRNSKRQNLDRALALVREGKESSATEFFQRAVNINAGHAKQVIEELKLRQINFIVAPYEADSQMAYLAHNDLVDIVVTEDSDLLAYGCPHVLFKMDKHGYAEELRFAEILKTPMFVGFNHQMFIEMCIFSGCDFLNSIPGIGIKKAYNHVKKLRSFPMVLRRMRYSGLKIPETYEEGFKKALMVFKHQTIWDPVSMSLKHLKPIASVSSTQGEERNAISSSSLNGDNDFLGPHYSDSLAKMVATAEVDPYTMEPFPSVQSQLHQSQSQSSQTVHGTIRSSIQSTVQIQSRRMSEFLSGSTAPSNTCKIAAGKKRGISSALSQEVASGKGSKAGFEVVTPSSRVTSQQGGGGGGILGLREANRIKARTNQCALLPKDKRIISKFFAGKAKASSDGAADRGELTAVVRADDSQPAPAIADGSNEVEGGFGSNSSGVQSCASEAKRVVKDITTHSLSNFLFQAGCSHILRKEILQGEKTAVAETVVSPPRKTHRLVDNRVCKPFVPPNSNNGGKKPESKGGQRTISFDQYLFNSNSKRQRH